MATVKFNYPEHYCRTAASAVKLAERLKKSGDFDLFRGQRHTFRITPSIFRPGVDRVTARRKLNKFAGWVHNTPDLGSLHGNDDAILAVAQHYGIRTPLLDFSFSPQVAGFFATHGGVEGDMGTIICINRRRFIESWSDINERHVASEGFPLTRVVEIDVRNLWRLQAQSGLFILCQVDPTMLEMFSYMLHIYFPQRSHTTILEEDRVYPKEKSHLEVLLDQYFLIDTYEERSRGLELIFGPPVITISEEEADSHVQSYFRPEGGQGHHDSWTSDYAKAWQIEPDERFLPDNRYRAVTIVIDDCSTTEKLENSIGSFIEETINVSAVPYRGHINWSVVGADGSVLYIDGEGSVSTVKDEWTLFKVSDMVNTIYAGMRYLPYTGAQVARSITRYILMIFFGCYQVIGDAEGVETSGGSIRGRGFCSRVTLLNAIRDDFYDLVKPEKLNDLKKMDFRDTIFAASRIKSSYVFERFVDLFVEDLIPSQAAVAVEGLTIVLNPMRIDVLGES